MTLEGGKGKRKKRKEKRFFLSSRRGEKGEGKAFEGERGGRGGRPESFTLVFNSCEQDGRGKKKETQAESLIC